MSEQKHAATGAASGIPQVSSTFASNRGGALI